ncbi:MAG: PAS domain S-box protein [Leptolyngbyaceae cyanobacterium bins.302]|nr:PAS domain S-box protein [Leptolyngbyaceae cyanobacterium bins.302]
MGYTMYRRVLPYAIAVSSVAIALLLTLWLQPLLTTTIVSFFYLAIIFTTWFSGIRPGVVAIILSTLAINYFFTPPFYTLTLADLSSLIRLSVFVIVACVITWLNNNLQQSKHKVEQLSQRLQAENFEQLRMALTAAHMGLWDWDMVTGKITWSPEHAYLLGLTPDAFDGRYETFDARLHPDDREALTQAVQFAIQHRTIYKHEYRVVWTDGSVHWIEGRGQTFYDEAGQPIRMAGTIMAIDDRKQAETKVKQLNVELEQRVAERTAELSEANDRLLHLLSEVQRSNQEIEDLYHHAPCGYHSIDREGCFVQINATELQWLGYTRQEILGRPIVDFLTAQSQQFFHQFFPKFLQTGQANNLEVEFVRRDGSTFCANLNTTAIYDESGRYLVSRSTLFDITDRKRAEKALQESETRYRTLIETIPQLTWISDPNGVITNSYSQRWFDYTGQTPESAARDGWLTVVHPDDIAQVQASWQEAVSNGKNYEAEYRLRRASDGTYVWHLAKANPIYDERGQLVSWYGTCTDISDRKQAESALAKLAAIVEFSDDAIISKTLDGTIVSWNASAEKLFGYTALEAINQSITLIIPEDRLSEGRDLIDRIQQGQSIQQYETVRQRKDGTLVDITITLSPIKDATGKIVGASKIAQDITEKRALDRMKTEFISIVSHELRTPLTALRGSLGLVVRGVYDKKPEKKQRMIEIASEQSDRLVRLVNDILDLQRLESGSMKLALQACDVATLLQQAAEVMRTYAEEHQVELIVRPLNCLVLAAPDAIIQTLTNLLSNAIKFSEPGSKIWLKAEVHSSTHPPLPAPHVLFSVKDEGRGIPADKLETIFERFQQVDASDAREKGGTGLGLAICRKIIQQHKGHIWAESLMPQGSTFYFTLPLVNGEY